MSAKKRVDPEHHALIRQDLEPLLFELFKKNFPWMNHVYRAETMCIRCESEYNSALDPYYCENCRPKG